MRRSSSFNPGGRRRPAADRRDLSLRAAGPVDAARPVAGDLQPRRIRLARLAAARDVRGRCVVSCGRPCDAGTVERAPFSPLAMALPFGIGQLLMAFMIYRATGEHDGED